MYEKESTLTLSNQKSAHKMCLWQKVEKFIPITIITLTLITTRRLYFINIVRGNLIKSQKEQKQPGI